MNYWLVKQEPDDYSFDMLEKDGGTAWTGVRNFQARNHLRAMRKADRVLFYHSGDEKRVVGLARVEGPAYPDPTAGEGDWVCVDLAPDRPLLKPVPLATLKTHPKLKNLPLIRQSRLSVLPVSEREFDLICSLGGLPE